MSKVLKMIAVDAANYDRLRKLGYAGESFNDVLGRVLDEKDERIAVEEAAILK
jgi:predicted CopG family antitoxin